MKKSKVFALAVSAMITTSSIHAADCCAKSGSQACCAATALAPSPLSEKSVYQLENSWTNDGGRTIQLTSCSGRPQIVAMFFAQCQYACPLLVYKMKQIEATLPEHIRTNVDFLLVSFDPGRDTPAELAKYRAQHDLGARWTLLHGAETDVQDLAAVLGIKYKQGADGQFMHSNVLTLLNDKGEIAYQEPGLALATTEMVRQIETIVKR